MYYYLLEQGRTTDNRFKERLADLATDAGIAGEMVSQSSLKPVDELLDLGLKKGYTTIVAVGSDLHIHRVLTAVMHRPPADRPVIGAIPTQPKSLVGLMLGATTLKTALQMLKVRHLAYATVTEIDPGKFLLTQAHLALPGRTKIEIDVDDAHLEVMATEVVLSGDCHVEFRDRGKTREQVGRGLAWLIGNTVVDRTVSSFHGERIRLHTAEPIRLMLDTETLAKTPVLAHRIRRALKIIIARATLAVDIPGTSSEPVADQVHR